MGARLLVRLPIPVLTVCVLALVEAGYAAVAGSKGPGSDLERALTQRMNEGSVGIVTRAVDCDPVGTSAGDGFRCVLTSARGTELVARVRTNGDGWTAAWQPLRG